MDGLSSSSDGLNRPPGYAVKVCTVNGTWYRRQDERSGGGGGERSNYAPCRPLAVHQTRTFVHIAAYAVSTAALLPALFIFFAYKYEPIFFSHY